MSKKLRTTCSMIFGRNRMLKIALKHLIVCLRQETVKIAWTAEKIKIKTKMKNLENNIDRKDRSLLAEGNRIEWLQPQRYFRVKKYFHNNKITITTLTYKTHTDP